MGINDGLQGMAIPFYSEAEWHKAKAACTDGHTFHATYGQFVAVVGAKQAQLMAQGIPTIRVYIDVDTFTAWCRRHGREIDAKARSEFAARQAAQQDGGGPAADAGNG